MAKKIMMLKGLVGKKLSAFGFEVEILWEVYRVNDDGRKTESVGLFRSEDIAKAFTENQTDKNWHKVGSGLYLTNGELAFEIKEKEMHLFGDEKAALETREKALKKLTVAERKILGV